MNNLYSDQLKLVDAPTLKHWLDQDQVFLIDVREKPEYAGEHIANSTLMPLSSFNPQAVPTQSSKKVVLYCQSSNRSGQAAQKLLAAGVPEVIHLRGGLNAWKQADYPTKSNQNAPISLMRQVQIVAGSFVLTGTLLGAFVSPWFLILSGFVGGGLLLAGITNTCALAQLLSKLPYNQRIAQ